MQVCNFLQLISCRRAAEPKLSSEILFLFSKNFPYFTFEMRKPLAAYAIVTQVWSLRGTAF